MARVASRWSRAAAADTLGAIRNMALVALALRLSGQRMQCVGWGCRSAESAHAYRTQLAHTAPTTIP